MPADAAAPAAQDAKSDSDTDTSEEEYRMLEAQCRDAVAAAADEFNSRLAAWKTNSSSSSAAVSTSTSENILGRGSDSSVDYSDDSEEYYSCDER